MVHLQGPIKSDMGDLFFPVTCTSATLQPWSAAGCSDVALSVNKKVRVVVFIKHLLPDA